MNNMNLKEFKLFVKDKKVICFGCGIQGKRMAAFFENWNLSQNMIAYIDNDISKIGTSYKYKNYVYPIISLDTAMDQYDSTVVILITSINYKSIYQQMKEKNCQFKYCFSIDEISGNQLQISDYDNVVKESQRQLIPKKIHYAWLGGEMPYQLRKNIEHWKELCQDYEFYEWNDKNYDVTSNKYMRQAYERGMWGFVPDYIRLDVVYKYGGIYLDTDIEMIQKPDELLYQECFGCFDGTMTMNLGSGFGAMPHVSIIKELRDYYHQIEFINKDGTVDNTSCNTHSYNVLERHGLQINDELQNVNGMNVYPMIFQGVNQHTRIRKVTSKTYWIHYGNMSWFNKSYKEIM